MCIYLVHPLLQTQTQSKHFISLQTHLRAGQQVVMEMQSSAGMMHLATWNKISSEVNKSEAKRSRSPPGVWPEYILNTSSSDGALGKIKVKVNNFFLFFFKCFNRH